MDTNTGAARVQASAFFEERRAPDTARKIEAEQVRLLFQQAPPGFLATIVNGAVLCAVLWPVSPPALIIGWYLLLAATTLYRYILVLLYRRRAPDSDSLAPWRLGFIAGAAAAGVCWGFAGTVLFPSQSFAHQMFLVFVLAGMSAGAVPFLAPVLAAFLVYLLPTLVPFTVLLLLQRDPIHIAMGLMAPLFLGVLVVTARRIHSTLRESLRLGYENVDLINDLSRAKEGLESANLGLRNSETRLRAILDNAVDGIITTSATGIIQSANPAAEEIFGYRANEIVGQHATALLLDSEREALFDYVRFYRQTRKARISGLGREFTGRRKNGTTFPLELAISDMQLGDQRVYTGFVRDITERRRIDRMKSEFIATVSHELRTPLTAIRGSLSLIDDGLGGRLPPEAAALLNIAGNNTERLLHLINDIVDMESIESGRMRFAMEPLALAPLLQEALERSRALAERHGVGVALEGEGDGVQVNADRARLLQVLENLISNAVKFSPRGRRVELAASRHGAWVRIAVHDYGTGIPESFHDQVLDKLTQAEAADGEPRGGAGLGLSLCKAIVERHGGQIGFEGRERQGTTFYVDLPQWQAPS